MSNDSAISVRISSLMPIILPNTFNLSPVTIYYPPPTMSNKSVPCSYKHLSNYPDSKAETTNTIAQNSLKPTLSIPQESNIS